MTPPEYRIAESNVHVDGKDKSIGNGIFAARDFAAGEEVLVLERPLVGSLESHHLPNACANCYVWTEGSATGTRLYVNKDIQVQKCGGCHRFRYCSKVGFIMLQSNAADVWQSCQKEAWSRGHKQECKSLRPVVGREIPKAVLACVELLSRRKHGLIPDSEWNILLSLQSHIDDMKSNGMYANIELMAMGASQISTTQNMFNRDFVAAMYARVSQTRLSHI